MNPLGDLTLAQTIDRLLSQVQTYHTVLANSLVRARINADVARLDRLPPCRPADDAAHSALTEGASSELLNSRPVNQNHAHIILQREFELAHDQAVHNARRRQIDACQNNAEARRLGALADEIRRERETLQEEAHRYQKRIEDADHYEKQAKIYKESRDSARQELELLRRQQQDVTLDPQLQEENEKLRFQLQEAQKRNDRLVDVAVEEVKRELETSRREANLQAQNAATSSLHVRRLEKKVANVLDLVERLSKQVTDGQPEAVLTLHPTDPTDPEDQTHRPEVHPIREGRLQLMSNGHMRAVGFTRSHNLTSLARLVQNDFKDDEDVDFYLLRAIKLKSNTVAENVQMDNEVVVAVPADSPGLIRIIAAAPNAPSVGDLPLPEQSGRGPPHRNVATQFVDFHPIFNALNEYCVPHPRVLPPVTSRTPPSSATGVPIAPPSTSSAVNRPPDAPPTPNKPSATATNDVVPPMRTPAPTEGEFEAPASCQPRDGATSGDAQYDQRHDDSSHAPHSA